MAFFGVSKGRTQSEAEPGAENWWPETMACDLCRESRALMWRVTDGTEVCKASPRLW